MVVCNVCMYRRAVTYITYVYKKSIQGILDVHLLERVVRRAEILYIAEDFCPYTATRLEFNRYEKRALSCPRGSLMMVLREVFLPEHPWDVGVCMFNKPESALRKEHEWDNSKTAALSGNAGVIHAGASQVTGHSSITALKPPGPSR